MESLKLISAATSKASAKARAEHAGLVSPQPGSEMMDVIISKRSNIEAAATSLGVSQHTSETRQTSGTGQRYVVFPHAFMVEAPELLIISNIICNSFDIGSETINADNARLKVAATAREKHPFTEAWYFATSDITWAISEDHTVVCLSNRYSGRIERAHGGWMLTANVEDQFFLEPLVHQLILFKIGEVLDQAIPERAVDGIARQVTEVLVDQGIDEGAELKLEAERREVLERFQRLDSALARVGITGGQQDLI